MRDLFSFFQGIEVPFQIKSPSVRSYKVVKRSISTVLYIAKLSLLLLKFDKL